MRFHRVSSMEFRDKFIGTQNMFRWFPSFRLGGSFVDSPLDQVSSVKHWFTVKWERIERGLGKEMSLGEFGKFVGIHKAGYWKELGSGNSNWTEGIWEGGLDQEQSY
jgi:hypothetical protein